MATILNPLLKRTALPNAEFAIVFESRKEAESMDAVSTNMLQPSS